MRYNRPSHIVDVACENDAKVHLLLFLQQQRMMHTTISRRLRWRLELLALVLTSTGENAILCDDGEQTPPHFLPTTSIYTTTTNTVMHEKRNTSINFAYKGGNA